MNIFALERSLSAKYYHEPADSLTIKHMEEDVRSVYPNVNEIKIDYDIVTRAVTLHLTFRTPEEDTWFRLKWM